MQQLFLEFERGLAGRSTRGYVETKSIARNVVIGMFMTHHLRDRKQLVPGPPGRPRMGVLDQRQSFQWGILNDSNTRKTILILTSLKNLKRIDKNHFITYLLNVCGVFCAF